MCRYGVAQFTVEEDLCLTKLDVGKGSVFVLQERCSNLVIVKGTILIQILQKYMFCCLDIGLSTANGLRVGHRG